MRSEKKEIVLIGHKNDPHVKGVLRELRQLNQRSILFDSLLPSDSFKATIEEGGIRIRGRHVSTDQIKSVWNFSPLRIVRNPQLVDESREFVRAEWHEGINSLWNTLDAKWINHPHSISNSLNRLSQLKLAKKLGMTIPRTLVTNDVKEFKEFYKNCDEQVIAKTLHSSRGVPKGKMIFTEKITEQDFPHLKDIQNAPCMFQEYVPKLTEFRVTIIGDIIHPVEIRSQMSEKTKIDWRNYDNFKLTPYLKAALPSNIRGKLLKLLKIMKLEFAAADLIKTPTGEFVFLEVNARGRWWWIQEITGANIAFDIARALSIG